LYEVGFDRTRGPLAHGIDQLVVRAAVAHGAEGACSLLAAVDTDLIGGLLRRRTERRFARDEERE
jgi:hypothetical protein